MVGPSREQVLGAGVRWLSTWSLRWIIILVAAYLVGRAVGLLSIVLGSTLFGIVGAFFAVPVVAVLAVNLRYLNEVVVARTPPPGVPDEVKNTPGTVSDPDIAEEIHAVREAVQQEAEESAQRDTAQQERARRLGAELREADRRTERDEKNAPTD